MEVLMVFFVTLFLGSAAEDFSKSCVAKKEIPTEVCMDSACVNAIKGQIKEELNAAFFYLEKAAYFNRYDVNRPGMAKFMFEAASEERSHAIQMLDYLTMRGSSFDITELFQASLSKSYDDKTAIYEALKDSLNKEIEVTKLIADIVISCKDDYHGADVFTNPILDEQHRGIRKLQGAISTYNTLVLKKKRTAEVNLAQYLFDLKVLKGEVL